MKHLMIDIETLGQTAEAVVLSIGAVFFDLEKGLHQERYKWVLDADQQIRGGRKVDAGTLGWWMKQGDAARSVIANSCGDGQEMRAAIGGLLKVCSDFSPKKQLLVWSNGANFDIVIMENILRSMRLPFPWDYWNTRCYRTMKTMFKIEEGKERGGVKHDCLEDAKFQAECILQYLQSNPSQDR